MRHYIASPLRGETREIVEENMKKAANYMQMVDFICGEVNQSIAPHAWLPQFTDDNIPEERQLALDVGCRILDGCQDLVICSDKITSGMSGEIERAKANANDIYVLRRLLMDQESSWLMLNAEDCYYDGKLLDIYRYEDLLKASPVEFPYSIIEEWGFYNILRNERLELSSKYGHVWLRSCGKVSITSKGNLSTCKVWLAMITYELYLELVR